MRAICLFWLVPAAVGCLNFGKVDDAKIPGELLGEYTVEANLDDSSCEGGALAALDPWGFTVKLSRFHDDLYWLNGREAIVGSIEPDGMSFSFSTAVETHVVPADRSREACVVRRSDAADGRLSADGTDVESFSGRLSFAFRATPASDCSEWVGSPEGATALPCAIEYSIVGTRMP